MPKPLLQAMVLADQVMRTDTGKFLIIGTFGTIFLRQPVVVPNPAGPSEIEGEEKTTVVASSIASVGTPYLYLALTGLHGRTPLRLRYINLSDASVSLEGQLEVESDSPLALAEYSVPLPSLVRAPGLYSLDVLYEQEILGSWRVTILVAPLAE